MVDERLFHDVTPGAIEALFADEACQASTESA
jgi:hypothetical protein